MERDLSLSEMESSNRYLIQQSCRIISSLMGIKGLLDIRSKSMNAVIAIRKHYIRRQTDGLYKTVVYTYIKINL